jgi:hypothetical protein
MLITTWIATGLLAVWSEIIGALGTIFPLILAHVLPGWGPAVWVSFASVIGLTSIQVLAIGLHLKRGKAKALPINFVLIALGIASAILIIVTR